MSIGPYLSAFASLATPQHVCQLKSVPQTILMRVHVLSAVQTKHGGEFGQKAAQERNKSGKPASGSSLMAELPTITYQAVIRAFSNVVAAVGHWQGRGGGHTVAPTVGLAVLAPPVSCAQISADNHCCHQVGPKIVLSHNLAIGHGSDVLMIAQGLKPSWLITGIII